MRAFRVLFFCLYTKRFVSEEIRSCGIDNAPEKTVSEGVANIEWYPWMGLLIYPYDTKEEMPQTSTVVLITKQLALATALEIDKFSKVDFREKSRVVLGHNCSLGPHLRVVEYVYHPDFNKNYYSALAMVQIKGTVKQEIIPICSPPTVFEEPDIYAMTLKHDCSSAMVRVYKMEYIDLNQCRDYYRRNDLDVESLWPKHVACARSLKGGSCMWRSGTVLVTRQHGKWRLLGVGVYGPGCEAPSRFLDYGKYHYWVARSIARIGRVAVTRMDPGHLILRRSSERIQRYGPCDIEEVKEEIYSEFTTVFPTQNLKNGTVGTANYNLTLHSRSDYSCIVLRIWHKGNLTSKSSLKLHKWCHSPYMMCGSANSMTIFFNVEITFVQQLEYNVRAFGREFKYIDAKRILYYLNQRKTYPPMPWDKTHGIPWQDYNEHGKGSGRTPSRWTDKVKNSTSFKFNRNSC